MHALGVTAREIDIRPAARQMLADIGHPFARGEQVYDVTFENVQAGLRTDYLFRLANQNGGLVVGTGDLSELGARLVHLRRRRSHVALQPQRLGVEDADPAPDPLRRRLRRRRRRRPPRSCTTSSTPKSRPSWCRPARAARSSRPSKIVGPYALQDFNLFYLTRSASGPRRSPSSLERLARRRARTLAGQHSAGSGAPTRWPRSGIGCAVPAALLRQPVQALGAAQRAEDLLGRLAVAARRLARAVRRGCHVWLRELRERARAMNAKAGIWDFPSVIKKDGAAWFEGAYDFVDAASFGETCADAWVQLREHKLHTATSIGALYGTLDEHLLDELQGAEISLGKA